ncbi:hypothetical protein QGM71_10170 [Virgibacillus sp. C22-A2]|uniref:Uncharacterized protein n=1 Tax=Virgibacillus tibetensis TaxID=3042313 RepID=A0ABU6KG37_9BACI|nr:hypothetical protein [Virgibacillus sp. C22-A2]
MKGVKEGREKFEKGIRSEQQAWFSTFVVGDPWTGDPLDCLHRGIQRAYRKR